MCGIFLGEEENNEILEMVGNRGRDQQKTVYKNGIVLFSSVLSIRGEVEQPILTEDFIFLYNGEIYNETASDTVFIKETIENILLQHDSNDIPQIAFNIHREINKYENELALVILFRNYIVFFKDDIGRKSLGYCKDKLQISSVCYQEEIDNLYLYIYSLEDKRTQKIMKESALPLYYRSNYFRIANFVKNKPEYEFINYEESFEHAKPIFLDIDECFLDNILFEATKKRLVDGNLVVLFSGGIDSNIILLYLLLASKDDQKLFLINSSFENSQDRRNAEMSHEKFKELFPGRSIELILVDLNVEMIKQHKKHLEDLIAPKTGRMDLNIASILYFASKEARKYSKVCYLGSGADEIFCGYSKYKEEDFRDRMLFDLFTISYHNTTRDDRVISDNNIEPRFPFLDTKVLSLSFQVNNEEIKNKNPLRKLLIKNGLESLSNFKKKAMQYGSGIYKIEKQIYQDK